MCLGVVLGATRAKTSEMIGMRRVDKRFVKPESGMESWRTTGVYEDRSQFIDTCTTLFSVNMTMGNNTWAATRFIV